MQQGPLEIPFRPDGSSVSVERTGLIATLPRSGSWLLSDGLQQTGLVGQPVEFFRPDYRPHFSRQWGLGPDHSIVDYIRAAQDRTVSDGGIFTAKLHWYQFEWLVDQLAGDPATNGAGPEGRLSELFPNLRFVYLTRRDKARQAVSYFRAAKSQRWFRSSAEPGGGDDGVELELSQIRYLEDSLLVQEQRWSDFFARAGLQVLDLVYEDFVDSYAFSVVRVLDSLGVGIGPQDVAVSPRIERQADEISERWLRDYLEVREHIQPTPFGRGLSAASGDRDPSPSLAPTGRGVTARADVPGLESTAEPSQEGSAAEAPPFSEAWRRWMATMKMRGNTDDRIVAIMSERGCEESRVRAELGDLSAHPYYKAGATLAQHLTKLETLAATSRTLRAAAEGPVVERRPDIGRYDFFENFYSRSRPLLLERVAEEWPARQWTPEVLAERLGDIEVEVMGDRETDPQYEIRSHTHKRTRRFADYARDLVRGGATNDTYLVANNHFMETGPGRALLPDLGPFPPFLLPDPTGTKTFFWFGPEGTVTPLHHDAMNIFFVQLYGRKRFLIAPPDHTPIVYNRIGVYSDVDAEAPDLTKYPAYQSARLTTVELGPGEAMFLPVGWWHHVRSLALSISVSFINFAGPNNYTITSPRPGLI